MEALDIPELIEYPRASPLPRENDEKMAKGPWRMWIRKGLGDCQIEWTHERMGIVRTIKESGSSVDHLTGGFLLVPESRIPVDTRQMDGVRTSIGWRRPSWPDAIAQCGSDHRGEGYCETPSVDRPSRLRRNSGNGSATWQSVAQGAGLR
jgi:hypothetical protein